MRVRFLPLALAACLAQDPRPAPTEEQAAALRALVAAAPKLDMRLDPIRIVKPSAAWTTDYVSWVAAGPGGVLYALCRNMNEDNVLVLDHDGRILRSWGKGLFTNPHSVRIDPQGNVWTVDSGSSKAIKFTPKGEKLLEIDIGEMPEGRSRFRGAADIAFAAGRIFIADGYGNARILEYDQSGKRVRAWGSAGVRPGQFHLPHSIAASPDRLLYVADRENGRIQWFDLDGRPLGQWDHLGKTFSVDFDAQGGLWIGTHPRNIANEAPGWIAKVDRKSGRILGYVETAGLHSVTSASGVLFTGARPHPDTVLRFRK